MDLLIGSKYGKIGFPVIFEFCGADSNCFERYPNILWACSLQCKSYWISYASLWNSTTVTMLVPAKRALSNKVIVWPIECIAKRTKRWPCMYNLSTPLSMLCWSIFELSLYCNNYNNKKGKNHEAKRSLWGRGSRLAIWCIYIAWL